jgi:glycosyltransferase involved in cell wall biosynthesis
LKILQLSHKIPYPVQDGGSLAIYNAAIGLLEAGADLHVLAMNPLRDQIDLETIPASFRSQTKFVAVPVDTRLKPFEAFFNLFGRESYFVKRFKSVEFEKALVEILSKNTVDIIQLEHLYLCLYIQTIRRHSKAKIVLRPQNVEFVIWEGILKNLRHPIQKILLRIALSRLKTFEQQIVSTVDGIIAISPIDAQIFATFAKGIPVVDIPVGFIFDKSKAYNFEKQHESFPVVYHLGSMDWRPNTEAMQWFVSDVLPLLETVLPDLKIYMAGKKMPDRFLNLKRSNLIVEGTVPDAIKYQEDKAIMIVPLLSGSGIRAKIIEGMALGKCVISTTVGLQGMKYMKGKDLLVADTPEEFVHQIKKCVESLSFRQKIGEAAHDRAFSEYHYLNCAQQMLRFYRRLSPSAELKNPKLSDKS